MLDKPPEKPTAKTDPALLARFAAIVGEKYAITDPRSAGAVSRRDARLVPRPHAGGVAAGLGRRGVGDPQTRQRDRRRRSCRRAAIPAWSAARSRSQRDRAVAQPARPHPRGRSDLEHHHLRGRRHLAAHARSRRRSRPALSATAAVGRHLHHRRQSFHQCRRHRGDRARHRALACARHRSGAGRRPRAQQSQQAEEGQYRLRPEKPVHRRRRHARHHHRGGAAAGAAPALGRNRLCRRGFAAKRRSNCLASRRSAPAATSRVSRS